MFKCAYAGAQVLDEKRNTKKKAKKNTKNAKKNMRQITKKNYKEK